MSQERKRVEKAPIAKITPKKREQPKIEEKPVEVVTEAKVIEKPKAKLKPVPKVEPKKREEVKATVVDKPKAKTKVVVKPEIKEEDLVNPEVAMADYKRARAKPSNDKYVRYASSEYAKNKAIISEKLLKNEMKFAYFAIDGDDFYHYYILTK
jgi:hypothetical protein